MNEKDLIASVESNRGTSLPSDLEDILVECARSTKTFCKVFFPETFFRPFSSIHDQIFEILDDDSIRLAAIAAPRGTGKSTILNFAYPIKRLLFEDSKFIVPISLSETSAVGFSERIKSELLANDMIAKVFGPQQGEVWSKEAWLSRKGIRVLPRGRGQQIRGQIYQNARPDLLPIDDIEDKEAVKSEERRISLSDWFFSDVLNCIDRGLKNYRIIFMGTILHERALLADLLKDKSFRSLRLEICNDDYESNYPELITSSEVRTMVEEARSRGKLQEFYMDYRNLVISPDNSFREAMFLHFVEADEKLDGNSEVENFIIIDPAKTTGPDSCESAIVAIAVNYRTNKVYVRDVFHGRVHPDALYQKAFEFAARYRVRAIGLEVTGLNEFITYPFRNEMLRRGLVYELVELKARGHKEDRIAALVPFYNKGLVYHNKATCSALESQLVAFPRSEFWDVMDAFAYMIEMLEIGERYFQDSEPDDGVSDELELRRMLLEDRQDRHSVDFELV